MSVSGRIPRVLLVISAVGLTASLSACGGQNAASIVSSAGAVAQSAASAAQSAAASLQSQAQSAASQLQSAASSAASQLQSAASSAASAAQSQLASATAGDVPAAAAPVVEAWWKEMDASTQQQTCDAYKAAPQATATASGGAIWAKTSMSTTATAEQKAVTGPQMVAAVGEFFAATCK